MTNYTIHFYGVQFFNGEVVDDIVEPISEQEYNALVEGVSLLKGDNIVGFYNAIKAARKRVKERFGSPIKVGDWYVMAEQK